MLGSCLDLSIVEVFNIGTLDIRWLLNRLYNTTTVIVGGIFQRYGGLQPICIARAVPRRTEASFSTSHISEAG